LLGPFRLPFGILSRHSIASAAKVRVPFAAYFDTWMDGNRKHPPALGRDMRGSAVCISVLHGWDGCLSRASLGTMWGAG
jgi:hypothetical protein